MDLIYTKQIAPTPGPTPKMRTAIMRGPPSKSSIESNKPRKESFKSNSFRVSSLVDETIVEELKTDDNNDNDDYVICKPSTSREENVGDITNNSNDIKLIWNKSSSSDEDINTKVSESGEQKNRMKSQTKARDEQLINERQRTVDRSSDPFNTDVMDELEVLLMQETTHSHNSNIDFISQMKSLLEPEEPKEREPDSKVTVIHSSPTTQPFESSPDVKDVKPVMNRKPEKTVNELKLQNKSFGINGNDNHFDHKRHTPSESASNKNKKTIQKLRQENNIEVKGIKRFDTNNKVNNNEEEVRRRSYSEFNKVEDSDSKPLEEQRRRSYAEVVAQRQTKQTFLDELKSSISARAKSYADVVSTSSNSEFEQIKETKIPILRANSNSSPIKQNVAKQTSNQSNSPKHNQLVAKHSNDSNSSKVLSKIPLPVKQSSIEQSMKSESTTSEDSVLTEDDNRHQSSLTKTSFNDSTVKSNGKVKNGAIRSSKLRRKVNELNDELKKGMNEKCLLAAENNSIKKQLMELSDKIQEESLHKFELENKLLKLESELKQYRFETEIKSKENNAIKTELQSIVCQFEDNQKECRILKEENQKMRNQIQTLQYEEQVLNQKLSQQYTTTTALAPVCDHQELIIEWKSKVDELNLQNDRLKRESEELQKLSIERQLEYERELFEWQETQSSN